MTRPLPLGLAIALATPMTVPSAAAQPAAAAPASPELRQAAGAVLNVLRGVADPSSIFTPAFLDQVSDAQISEISASLARQHGAVGELIAVEPRSATSGTIRIRFERAILAMQLAIGPQAPHRIAGLLVTGVEPTGDDSGAAIVQELQSLPGQSNFAIVRLDEGGPTQIAGHNPDQALAIGSAFKLVILGELSRQVRARQRRWSDVVPIDRHSLPSGLLQDWPLGSPATLHTLAALMISHSDNTATDVLLRLAGRENVERMMTTMGIRSAARNRPFLSTMEAFRLKADDTAVLERWRTGGEAARRRLLSERYQEVGGSVDFSRLADGPPAAIDTVEWFASAADMGRVMDWLRRNGDAGTHAIMAISPGVSAAARTAFAYIGYKGGSEPGVINLTYLVRNNGGVWHAVTGSWNNPAAPIDDARFAALLARALQLVR